MLPLCFCHLLQNHLTEFMILFWRIVNISTNSVVFPVTNTCYLWSYFVIVDIIYYTLFCLILQNNEIEWGPSWPWSYDSWIYNYLRHQGLSPLMLWVRILISARCTTLCDKVCQWLAAGRWFSPGTPVYSTNKTDRHDITEILLKVALSTINQTHKHK